MTRIDLALIAAGGLFAAFVLGWLAGWITHRAERSGTIKTSADPTPLAPRPVAGGETDGAARALRAESEAQQARAELREAHVEIEELRAYIERKLAKRSPEGG